MKPNREKILGASNFESALKKLKTENTDIGSLQITDSLSDEQVISVLEFLETDTNINEIYIETFITDIQCGIDKLSAIFKINKSIEQLHLCDCKIEDEGVIAIVDALRSNESLTNLDLCSNDIGKRGAIALSELLKDNKFLQKLIITDNDLLGFEELEIIKTSLKSNFHLRNFFYDDTLDPLNSLLPLLERNNKIFNEALRVIKTVGESESNEINVGNISSNFIFKFIQNSSQNAFDPEVALYLPKSHHLICKHFFVITGVCKNPVNFGLPTELYTQVMHTLKLEDISWNYELKTVHLDVEEGVSVSGDDTGMFNV